MTAQEIRQAFLDFFHQNNHTIVESSSLVPSDDPTLLFANAGMNQFKEIFTGQKKAPYQNAVSIQKCLRAGGKHNDLENVGFTARHHTFFEMLGNFSFGGYFKQEAMKFAWEFLTKKLKISSAKLYVSVHETDDEAFDLWQKEIGLDASKIFRRGDKDNFWEMGELGPCGPCSEIFYDHGEQFATPGKHKQLLDDEARYVEIWNLVFMQYEKLPGGERQKLPVPCVDTGAGLERIAAVCQNVYWNYQTDLFLPLISNLLKKTKESWDSTEHKNAYRVISDHVRSATMLISEGVIPGNEGRSHVLRRIIRRGVRHLDDLGIHTPYLCELVPVVFETLGQTYPQNKKNAELARKVLKKEEEQFRKTLHQGLELLDDFLGQRESGCQDLFPGEQVFKLYDTYGLPFDLTESILKEKGIAIDSAALEELVEKSKELSRKHSSFTASSGEQKTQFYELLEKFGATKFTGFSDLKSESRLLHLIDLGDESFALFDQTPFYSRSGGQAGDAGVVITQDGIQVSVLDTFHPIKNLVLHKIQHKENLKINQTYTLRVSKEQRSLTARNHSATHLLQAALIKTLGKHVTQAGSDVNQFRLRFDFTHPEPLSEEQKSEVECWINKAILEDSSIEIKEMEKDEAIALGAMALFGEKYEQKVRTIRMGDDSFELCGGTHVSQTNEIGLFVLTSESSLSSGIRRIEGKTSLHAYNFLKQRSKVLAALEDQLSSPADQLTDRVSQLKLKLQNSKKVKTQIETQRPFELSHPEKLGNGVLFLCQDLKDAQQDMRSLADDFIGRSSDGFLILKKQSGDKHQILMRIRRGHPQWNLKDLFKKHAHVIEADGGGRPDMIQGVLRRPENFESFCKAIKESLI